MTEPIVPLRSVSAPGSVPAIGRASAKQEFIIGAKMLGRGFRAWKTHPRIMLIGAIPVAIVAVVYTVLLVWWLVNVPSTIQAWLPFLSDWSPPWQQLGRVLAAIVFVAIGGVLAVFTFSAVVLLIAGPFLDHISSRIERELGGIQHPGPPISFVRELGRSLGDSLRLIGIGVTVSVIVFLCGLIPLIGTIAGLCIGAVIGGFALALEFTGTPASARGMRFAERKRLLQSHRARATGFGACTYLVFLLPLGAVIAAPAAAVGATLLVRSLVAEPTSTVRFP